MKEHYENNYNKNDWESKKVYSKCKQKPCCNIRIKNTLICSGKKRRFTKKTELVDLEGSDNE